MGWLSLIITQREQNQKKITTAADTAKTVMSYLFLRYTRQKKRKTCFESLREHLTAVCMELEVSIRGEAKGEKGKKSLFHSECLGEKQPSEIFVLFFSNPTISLAFISTFHKFEHKKRFLFSRFWYTMDDRWRIRKFTEKRSRKRELRTSMTMNEENRFIWRLLYNAVQSMKFMHVLNKTS